MADTGLRLSARRRRSSAPRVGRGLRAWWNAALCQSCLLPGHSFVLIDRDGVQRWYGEYPSTYLSPTDLLTEVQNIFKRLTSVGVAG